MSAGARYARRPILAVRVRPTETHTPPRDPTIRMVPLLLAMKPDDVIAAIRTYMAPRELLLREKRRRC
jgi:hypothetical protein